MSRATRKRTRRDRRKDAETRNAEGEATAQAIHAANPRKKRAYRAYLAEKAKPKGTRSPEALVTLRARFTPTPKTRKPKRHARGGRRNRGPPRRGAPARR